MGSRDTGEDEFSKSFAASMGFPWDKSMVAPTPIDIHTGAALGEYDCVRKFLEGGVDCNMANKGGWTPLTYAAYVGHDNIISLLLDWPGININHQAKDGSTALMWAAACGNESVLYFLLRKKCDVNLRDNVGRTALMYATKKGQQRAAKSLLEHGADIEACNMITGDTALIEATHEGFESLVQILIDNGANIHARNYKGESAEDVARSSHAPKLAIISLLEKTLKKSPGGELRSEAGLSLDTPDSSPHDSMKAKVDIRAGPAALLSMIAPPKLVLKDELEEFLEFLQLTKYLELFRREEIDFATLMTMSEDDLKAIGLTLFGPRRKISSAIKKWVDENKGSVRKPKVVSPMPATHAPPAVPATHAPPAPSGMATEVVAAVTATRPGISLYGEEEEEDLSTLAAQMKETFDLHVQREVSGLSMQVDELRQSLTDARLDKERLQRELDSERHLRNLYEGQLVEFSTQQQPSNPPQRLPPISSDVTEATMRRLPPLTTLAQPGSPSAAYIRPELRKGST